MQIQPIALLVELSTIMYSSVRLMCLEIDVLQMPAQELMVWIFVMMINLRMIPVQIILNSVLVVGHAINRKTVQDASKQLLQEIPVKYVSIR